MSTKLTSRRKRPLNREISHFRDTRLIIIATEDTYAVKQYFESEIFDNPRIQVQVLETPGVEENGTQDTASAPKYIFARLREFVDSYDLDTEDILCVMIDRDRWPERMLSEVCQHTFRLRNGRKNVQMAVSNPSFELWLYLHHSEWTQGAVASKQMEQALRQLLGAYRKNKINVDIYIGNEDTAVLRAKNMDTMPERRWPDNPGTHVYRIVEVIKGLSTNK